MKKIDFAHGLRLKFTLCLLFLFLSPLLFSQTIAKNNTKAFWDDVRFGGGFGLNLGSGFTEITLVPSAIKPINNQLSVGAGLLGSYTNSKDYYTTGIYGLTAIVLFDPIKEVQLSLELEQTRVSTTYKYIPNPITSNYWNTGLFVGGGYRSGNITLGARYNLLFDKDKSIYSSALMPFVRFYF